MLFDGDTLFFGEKVTKLTMRSLFKPILIALFLASFVYASAVAQEAVKAAETAQSVHPDKNFEFYAMKKIKVGDAEYYRSHIMADFLDIAFSERLWNEDAGLAADDGFARMIAWYKRSSWDLKDKKARYGYDSRKKYTPWLADYMYRPHGWPRHNVINKWEGDITIGMGWPTYGYKEKVNVPPEKRGPDGKAVIWQGQNFNKKEAEAFYPLITEQVKALLPVIEQRTGLPAHLIMPDDPRDDTKNYARIRIVPAPVWPHRSHYSSSGYETSIYDFEEWLWGGVLFETAHYTQMDAFMLPQPNNRPGLVVCKIRMELPEDFFRTLITECLVRAMGLPDLSGLSSAALIGDWRGEFGARPVPTQHPEQYELIQAPLTKFTPYDEFMISLLYCPAIKPGMDKHDVLQVLTSNDECISNHFNP